MSKILRHLDFAKVSEIQNALIHKLASAPSSPGEGQIFTHTGTHDIQFWNGTEWVTVDARLRTNIPIGNLTVNPLDRANHTGTQTADTISDLATIVKAYKLNEFAGPNASLDFNFQKGINVATPTAPNDLVNKSYADNLALGLKQRYEVLAATDGFSVGTYTATGGASGRGQLTSCPTTLDGVTLSTGKRILIKNHSNAAANGIYVVTTLGSGANGIWDRAADADEDGEITNSTFVFVGDGTVNKDTGWTVSTTGDITLGGSSGTAITFTQFSGGGSIDAGSGLTKSGNVLNIGAGTGITVNADDVQIDTSVVARKVAATIGNGSATSLVVTHNLNNIDVLVQVKEVSTKQVVYCDIEMTDANNVTLIFTTAPSTNQYKVVVIG